MASSARSDGACLARRPCSQRRSHRSGFLTLRSVLWLILFVTGSTSTEHRKLGSVMCNIRASRQRAGAQTREPRPLGLDSRAHRSLKCEKSTCMSTKMARRRHQTLSRGVLLCGCRHLRGKSPAPLLSFEFTQEGYVAYSTHTDRRARVKLAEGRLVLFDSAQRYALATLVVRNGARPGNVKQQWPQRLRQTIREHTRISTSSAIASGRSSWAGKTFLFCRIRPIRQRICCLHPWALIAKTHDAKNAFDPARAVSHRSLIAPRESSIPRP